MLNASTIEQLRAVKFSAMAAAFEQQLKDWLFTESCGIQAKQEAEQDSERG